MNIREEADQVAREHIGWMLDEEMGRRERKEVLVALGVQWREITWDDLIAVLSRSWEDDRRWQVEIWPRHLSPGERDMGASIL